MIDQLLRILPGFSSNGQRLGAHHGTIRNVSICADGSCAGTASGDHTAKIWDLGRGQHRSDLGSEPKNLTGGGVGTGHLHIVTGIDLSPDGCFAATVSYDKCLRIWAVCFQSFSKFQVLLRQFSDAIIHMQVNDGDPLAVLQGHMQIINCCRWMPDGLSILSGSTDGTLRRWSLFNRANNQNPADFHSFPWLIRAQSFSCVAYRSISPALSEGPVCSSKFSFSLHAQPHVVLWPAFLRRWGTNALGEPQGGSRGGAPGVPSRSMYPGSFCRVPFVQMLQCGALELV